MEIIATGILTFAATNIDDIFLLMLFYGNKQFKEQAIISGQLTGIMALTAVSLIASLLGLLIAKHYIGLFGLIPIFLGIKGLLLQLRSKGANRLSEAEKNKVKGNNFLTVAGATFANGGDNIGVYTPLFATLAWPGKLTLVLVFIIMTFAWCLAAKYLTAHPYVAKTINKYGQVITPLVLILLGIYILYENQLLQLLAR